MAAGVLWLGFVVWAAMPASAQVDVRYTGPGVVVPTINTPAGGVNAVGGGLAAGGPVGGVLAAAGGQAAGGQAAVSPAGGGIPTQVLPSQVSGAVGATSRAPITGLAFTGADVLTMVTIGLLTLTLGIVLTRRARPSTAPKP